jgi:phosphohistidine phosphatase SixA
MTSGRITPQAYETLSACLCHRDRVRVRGVVGLSVCVVAAGIVGAVSRGATNADPALASAMQRGGLVLVLRHAATNFSKPDQDPVVLSDCQTQRNLNAQGRVDARTIGRGVRRLRLRIGKVFASPFCRTKETARLAVGRFTVSGALLNTIVAEHDARWRAQIRAARRLLGTRPAQGTLTVLVTHGSVVGDTTGHALEEGETLVFRPLGSSRFRLLGRILPAEWRTLRST